MKKFAFLLLSLSVLTALIFVACRKDRLFFSEENAETMLQESNACRVIVRGQGGTGAWYRESGSNADEPKKMILGAKKPNPFARSVMTQAYNNIYEPDVAQVPHTHLYVRFLPATPEEYKALDDTEGLILFDFPLDHEIVEQGTYYHDPAIPEENITWQYAVVPTDFIFPNVQYEVLEHIVNAPFKTSLVREAFRLAYGGEEGLRQYAQARNDEYCTPECESYPECLEAPELSCAPTGTPPYNGSGNTGEIPCSVFHPNWPECANNEIPCDITHPLWPDCGGYEPPSSPPMIANGCGCPVRQDKQRYPGGCVRAVDTQLPVNGSLPNGAPVHLDGVKQAKIVWWDGWFGVWETHTDDNGCWQIKKEDYGKGHMWVRFKNARAKIRGILDPNIWGYSIAATDYVGEFNGPQFNNISVVYNIGGGIGSPSLMFWHAATANNALWDYYQYASADGVMLPPSDLKVLLTNTGGFGRAAAPMLDKTGFAWQAMFAPIIFLAVYVGPSALAATPLSAYFAAFAPDVIYNYGTPILFSDRVKEVFYHEFAHASHYAGLPAGERDNYWNANVAYVLTNEYLNNNSPYGTRGTPGSQRCAVIEMWGFHLGPHYADRKYGVFHSRSPNAFPATIQATRWLYTQEPFLPDIAGGNLDNFIPMGLFHDLWDDNALNPAGVVDGIVDPVVSSFPHVAFFNAVRNGAPTTIPVVETSINTMLPPGITPAMTRPIFAQHGY